MLGALPKYAKNSEIKNKDGLNTPQMESCHLSNEPFKLIVHAWGPVVMDTWKKKKCWQPLQLHLQQNRAPAAALDLELWAVTFFAMAMAAVVVLTELLQA